MSLLYWTVACSTLVLASLPLLMLLGNLSVFEQPRQGGRNRDEAIPVVPPTISILIPARNEAGAIEASVSSILANAGWVGEIVVLDDHSTDGTAEIVRRMAQCEPRVRLEPSRPLPAGWNGKQHACWQLANLCRGDRLLFLDADVRLANDALECIDAQYCRSKVDLLSGFPRQITLSWSERMLIPLMYLVLLCYLPLRRARKDNRPPLAAGCGQLFYTSRAAYFAVGGHSALPASRHDGLMLPREYRRAGRTTDVFDAGQIATCRMYNNVRSVVAGLLKNAVEGIANPRLIGIFTLLLLGGFVLPLLLWAHAVFWNWSQGPSALLAASAVISFLPRLLIAMRFEQQLWTAIFNPVSITWFVWLQWLAAWRCFRGRSIAWRGRTS